MPHAGAQEKITMIRTAALLDKDTASGLSTTTATPIDMTGYDRVVFDIQLFKFVNGAVFDAWVVESDESNLGNATNVRGVINGTENQLAAIPQRLAANGNDTVQTIDVYRPTQRYVGLTLKTATQNITLVSATARQYRGSGVNPPTPTTDHGYVSVRVN